MSHHLQAEKNTIQIDERLQMPQMVAIAADLAQHILDSDPDRLAHSKAAARRAEFLTLAVEPECAALLVAAAWLHDIGYAPGLRDTGFHPIDGARHLQTIGWPPAICNLVAHHSGARFVASILPSIDNLRRIRSRRTPCLTPLPSPTKPLARTAKR